jgi:hypothetical protein
MEDSHSFGQLSFRIPFNPDQFSLQVTDGFANLPRTKYVQQTGKERAFKKSNQESEYVKLRHVVHPSLSKRKYSPAYFHTCQPITWPDFLDDQC